jgi:L-2,4-diaminobutyrate transaminase
VNELDLVANAGEVGAYFKKAMADAVGDNCFLGEVRGEGLMAAIEFVRVQDDWVFFDASEKVGPRITAALLDKGVIGRAMPQGDILGLAPPLCPTREEADTIVAATKDTVEAVTATL